MMVPLNRDLEILRQFNEKAEELKNSQVCRMVFNEDTLVYLILRKNKPIRAGKHGPSQDAINAFVLTFRQFIQKKDIISIERIAKIYSRLPISKNMKVEFERIKDKYDNFIDAESRYKFNMRQLKNKDILVTFIYGDLAHMEMNKREIFKKWMNDRFFKPTIENGFVNILARTINFINAIWELNCKVIKELIKNQH